MGGELVDDLTRLRAAGVPTTALSGQLLSPVALTTGENGPVAHRPGRCGTPPTTAVTLPLSAVTPIAGGGVGLCTDCDVLVAAPRAVRAWIAAAVSAHAALRDAETALLRPTGHPNLQISLARQLGALALAPLGAASASPALLGADAGWFTARAEQVAAARAALLARSGHLLGDDELAELAAPYAVTVTCGGRRDAPDAGRVADEVNELLPEDIDALDVTTVWEKLLKWPWLSWQTGQVARVCAAAAGRDADDESTVEAFDDVAAFLLDRWDEPIAEALEHRTPHLVAAGAVEPHASFAYSPRELLSTVLAAHTPVVCLREGPPRGRMSVLLVVPQVVAAGLAVADRRCVDLGPLRPEDGPGTWRTLSALWTPAEEGSPLGDPAVALATARGVAAG